MKAVSAGKFPKLLWAGIALLLGFQLLHFLFVADKLRGSAFEWPGRYINANITPLAWCAYLVFLLGLLSAWDGVSWLKRHRNRFFACWLWSVAAWCYFDWMNFYFMRDPATGKRAWEYLNLPVNFPDRLVGYLLAFGAIAPGMFLTAEVLQRLGFARIRSKPMQLSPRRQRILAGCVLAIGLLLAPIPILVGGPACNLAIWVGTWALLDPINLLAGRPSILRDWSQGRWGRTLALGLGGLICGLLWEFWNYWALAKWVYHLPFLGSWENIRYFEMPVPGLAGFIPFGVETWAMWQFSLLLFARGVEGERKTPEDANLHDYGCF
jgi:hypothetical protein